MTPKVRPSYLRLVRPCQLRSVVYAADVIEHVATRTGVDAQRFVGPDVSRDVTYARHLAMYLLREDRRLGTVDIGRSMSVAAMEVLFNRDHSSIIDGIRRIDLERLVRRETQADIDAVRSALEKLAKERMKWSRR